MTGSFPRRRRCAHGPPLRAKAGNRQSGHALIALLSHWGPRSLCRPQHPGHDRRVHPVAFHPAHGRVPAPPPLPGTRNAHLPARRPVLDLPPTHLIQSRPPGISAAAAIRQEALDFAESIRSIPADQMPGALGLLAAISPTVRRLCLEMTDRHADEIAAASKGSTQRRSPTRSARSWRTSSTSWTAGSRHSLTGCNTPQAGDRPFRGGWGSSAGGSRSPPSIVEESEWRQASAPGQQDGSGGLGEEAGSLPP